MRNGRTASTLDYLQECTCLFKRSIKLYCNIQVEVHILCDLQARHQKVISYMTEEITWRSLRSQLIFPKKKSSGLTCIARGNGFRDVWAEHSKVKMARLQRTTSRKGMVRLSSEEGWEDERRDAGPLTTSSFSMAAESLSPVALNSNTRATGPLQPRHLEEVKTVAVWRLSPNGLKYFSWKHLAWFMLVKYEYAACKYFNTSVLWSTIKVIWFC